MLEELFAILLVDIKNSNIRIGERVKNKEIKTHMLIVILLVYTITILSPLWYSILPLNLLIRLFLLPVPYVLYIFVILFTNMKIEHKTWTDLGFSSQHIFLQMIIGIILTILVVLIFVGSPFILQISPEQFLPSKDKAIMFQIVYKLFFIGFGEELIFRGYLQNRLTLIFSSKWIALIITSLLFGSWHFILNHSLPQVVITSVFGFMLGWAHMKIKYCSTLSVSISHGLYDLILVLLSYFLL